MKKDFSNRAKEAFQNFKKPFKLSEAEKKALQEEAKNEAFIQRLL